jgi:hypothetical protein
MKPYMHDNRGLTVSRFKTAALGAVVTFALLGSANADMLTVKEWISRAQDPAQKSAALAYAVGVGHGFYSYQLFGELINPTDESRVFCPPTQMPWNDSFILSVVRQITDKAKDEAVAKSDFNIELLAQLIRIFPCKD